MSELDKKFIDVLKDIFGKDGVSTDLAERTCYAYDSTRLQALPDVVVQATDAQQIAALMRLADEHRVPVYPQAARTSRVGAAVPIRGGVALDLTRMNRIVEVDPANLTATVEPGVVTADLQKAAAKFGLFYPPDPASNAYSTIGGNVAQCAGGLRCLKYGTTRDYVIALEVVLPGGEIIETGFKVFKNSTGYNLTGLLVGSEGTLGIFTKITVKLLPAPAHVVTALAYFGDQMDALKAVSEIVAAHIVPRALEFMDEKTVGCVQTHQNFDIPAGTGAALLIEIDGGGPEIERDMSAALEICGKHGAFEIFRAADGVQREEAWELRRSISPAIQSISPEGKIGEDVCVPRSQLAALLKKINEIFAKHDTRVVSFGHAGDGTLHVNALLDLADEAQKARAHAAIEEMFRAAIELGGVLSGEHGIGLAKAQYMTLQFAPEQLALMRRIKRVFDPNGILNPGKIFPPENEQQ